MNPLPPRIVAPCAAFSLAAVAFAAAAVSGAPVFSDPLSIDNPFFPFVVGRLKHFETQQGHTDAEDYHDYTADTRTFAWNGTSVACRVLEEISIEDGVLVEISRNYFAQADDGRVFYFGEVVDNYDGPVIVNHDGSWLVGPLGPTDPPETAVATDPAVYMPDDPQVGDVWKPEDLYPFVDETDTAVKVGQRVRTPVGSFQGCVQVRESSLLSTSTETKWYAPGMGPVKVKEHGEILVLDEVTGP